MLMTPDWASYLKFRAYLTKPCRAVIAYLELSLESCGNDGRLRACDELVYFEFSALADQFQVRKLAGRHQMGKIDASFGWRHDVLQAFSRIAGRSTLNR